MHRSLNEKYRLLWHSHCSHKNFCPNHSFPHFSSTSNLFQLRNGTKAAADDAAAPKVQTPSKTPLNAFFCQFGFTFTFDYWHFKFAFHCSNFTFTFHCANFTFTSQCSHFNFIFHCSNFTFTLHCANFTFTFHCLHFNFTFHCSNFTFTFHC